MCREDQWVAKGGQRNSECAETGEQRQCPWKECASVEVDCSIDGKESREMIRTRCKKCSVGGEETLDSELMDDFVDVPGD